MNKITRKLCILPSFFAIFCVSCSTTTKTDCQSYNEILWDCIKDKDFHSQLYIFPQSIEGLEVTKFYFSNTTDLFNGSWLMYLGLKWSEGGFKTELSRLDNVKAVYITGNEKPILKYEDKSLYVTVCRDNRYEYVLYDSNNFEIVYISNQLYQWKDTPVESKHIIPKITIPKELDDGNNSYNIYYRYEGDVGWEVVD